MNESLRRALLQARLSEEDVAARLQVDPKTVRRWLEGRVPYPRHRWLLAATLGLDEADLWPLLAASRSRPQGIQTIYSHHEDVPRETWLRLFGDAQDRIDILARSGLFLDVDPELWAILADRAAAGVKERICLGPQVMSDGALQEPFGLSAGRKKQVLKKYASLNDCGEVEVRVHNVQPNNSICRSDGECLIALSAYGVSASRVPVMHLHRTRGHDIFQSYLEEFEAVWANASAVVWR